MRGDDLPQSLPKGLHARQFLIQKFVKRPNVRRSDARRLPLHVTFDRAHVHEPARPRLLPEPQELARLLARLVSDQLERGAVQPRDGEDTSP